MAFRTWDQFGDVGALQRDVSEFFNRMFTPQSGTRAGDGPRVAMVPPIDAYRTDEEVVVTMELPGFTPDDVDIEVENAVLTVSGQRARTADVPEENWLRRERPVGEFSRTFTLPEGTDPNKIRADFAHGVLELRIPQPEERKPHRIRISAGEQQKAVGTGEDS
jgi:HSP20 family protein